MPASNESTHFILKPSHDRDECSMVLLKSSKEFDAIQGAVTAWFSKTINYISI